MNLFALTTTQEAGGQIALAAALGAAGFFLLLPRPRGRFVPGGIAALIAAAAVFAAWAYTTFGDPMPDVIGSALFWLFSASALTFGAVLVAQKNPARGAIAFAFVVLSTCGLFLLLAAPFLMAATVIIYAGAIIVTFLFVLMLSQSAGPSDENDRSREPLYGSFAGFAFVGLVLFTLYQTSLAGRPAEAGEPAPTGRLPLAAVTAEERAKLAEAITGLEAAASELDGDTGTNAARAERVKAFEKAYAPLKDALTEVVGTSGKDTSGGTREGSIRVRLEQSAARPGRAAVLYRDDAQARDALRRAGLVREATFTTRQRVEASLMAEKPDAEEAKAAVRDLKNEAALLYGMGELPASNVRNLGYLLYSEHLLAIELAGTLLLVAVIGAIAVAHRKRVEAEPVGGFAANGRVAK
jgi:NADH:ubiquinone oxidoreductase subunit 6 (subunit J)